MKIQGSFVSELLRALWHSEGPSLGPSKKVKHEPSPGEPDEPDLSKFQNYFISKLCYRIVFSKINQEFQVLNEIRNHKMVSKYFFGLNIANLSSLYDRLLCPGPLPGTLLF